MAMKRCPQGHYFDPAKHTSCPVCGVDGLEIGVTTPRRGVDRMGGQPGGADPDLAVTQPRGAKTPPAPPEGGTRKADVPAEGDKAASPPPQAEEGVTRRVIYKDLSINPVVGWLVCVQGPEKGRDYRIRSEKNYIGRSEAMQICIKGDDSISRDKHGIISYNPKTNSFRIMPGESVGLVFLNEKEVDQPQDLAPYDTIELGKTKLLFVPFCGEKFQWS
ncbi:MAG: FHA domain-containing protein [Desulfovibrio sp.]|nr:MAG: FHA domain-containing protein [Desulfovibrio sp.]